MYCIKIVGAGHVGLSGTMAACIWAGLGSNFSHETDWPN